MFWWLPCFLPWLLAKRLHLYIGYDGTVKVLAAGILWPLWLWGAFRLINHYIGQSGISILVLVIFFGLAFFAERYQDVFSWFREKRKALVFAKKQPAAWTALLEKREAILRAISKD